MLNAPYEACPIEYYTYISRSTNVLIMHRIFLTVEYMVYLAENEPVAAPSPLIQLCHLRKYR